jgi:acyl-CoA thioesterase FadM
MTYHQVRYQWHDKSGHLHHGRTVVKAKDQSQANHKLQRTHRHITVIP